jgi:hypothetical protein
MPDNNNNNNNNNINMSIRLKVTLLLNNYSKDRLPTKTNLVHQESSTQIQLIA